MNKFRYINFEKDIKICNKYNKFNYFNIINYKNDFLLMLLNFLGMYKFIGISLLYKGLIMSRISSAPNLEELCYLK